MAGTASHCPLRLKPGYAADWALFADWCAATSVRLRSVEVAVGDDPGRLRQGSIRGRPAQHSSVCHCELKLPVLRPTGTATESAHIRSWWSAIYLVEVAQEGRANRWTSRTWRRPDMGSAVGRTNDVHTGHTHFGTIGCSALSTNGNVMITVRKKCCRCTVNAPHASKVPHPGLVSAVTA